MAIRVVFLQNTSGTRKARLEKSMTTFDDREKSYEKRFALDEELKFRSEQRRNKLIGEWAAGKLGLTGPAVEDYIKTVRKADLASKGDEDVFVKIRQDFDAKAVAVPDAELRKAMADFLIKAIDQIEGERKA
jgi:hypothetical protein